MVQIVVVGGGPAGMMAAIKAAESGAEVVLLEKNHLCGRKLAITGKGRCNITNTKPWGEFATHVHPKSNFVKSAFFNFSNAATIDFFNSIGLETVETQGNRVFPKSMNAFDVVDALVNRLKQVGVKLITDADLLAVCTDGSKFKCTYNDISSPRIIRTEVIMSNALIIATGGLSYPATGSNGKGYDLAESLGHSVTRCFPSLAALMPKAYDSELYDIELKNVGLNLFVDKDLIQSEMGDLTFTEDGIEGPLGFRVSRRAVNALENGSSVELVIDLKPALSPEQLDARILRDFAENLNRDFINGIRKLLPAKLIPVAVRLSGISPEQKVNGITKEQRHKFGELIKAFPIRISGFRPIDEAIITSGGVSVKEIDPRTMESKIMPGLFFAGEVIDIDAYTGGFNLQIAFSTAYSAALYM